MLALAITGIAGAAGTFDSSTDTSISVTFDGYACGQTHTFTDDTGQSVSGSTTPCPDTQAPSTPANLTVTSADSSSLDASWSPSTDNVGVSWYDVYLDGAFVNSCFDCVNANPTYHFAGLSAGSSHTVWVIAADAAHNYSPKAIASGTVQEAAAPPYMTQAFEAIPTSPWIFEASAPQGGQAVGSHSINTGGVSGNFVREHTPAATSWNSNQGQLVSDYLGNGSAPVHTGEGETTWYRVHVRTDTNYIPGEWDWLIEWHNNTTTVPGTLSTTWGLVSSGSISGPNRGTSPYLEFIARGGATGNGSYTTTKYRMPSGSWTGNTWHDLVAEITWGTSSSSGAVSLWVDGQPFPGYTWPQHVPTLLYNSSTGTRDNPAFGVYNYHYSVTFPVDRDYDEVEIGPTAASVGFTP